MSVTATMPSRRTIVRSICLREWKESLGNRLLVGMSMNRMRKYVAMSPCTASAGSRPTTAGDAA